MTSPIIPYQVIQCRLCHQISLVRKTKIDLRVSLPSLDQELKEKTHSHYTPIRKTEKPDLSPRIILNVRGTLFTTTLYILTSTVVESSYFTTRFSGRWNTTYSDCDGNFIDRDPTLFQHILNFLRDNKFDTSILSISDRSKLAEEADFYCLNTLVNILLPEKSTETFSLGPNYKLEDNGKRVTRTAQTTCFWNCTVLGPEIKLNSILRVHLVSPHRNIMVGIAPLNIDPDNYNSHKKENCGWYFSGVNQSLYAGSISKYSRPYTGCTQCLAERSTVGVQLCQCGAISFMVDDLDLGIAYVVPSEEKYRLTVLMRDINSVVELI